MYRWWREEREYERFSQSPRDITRTFELTFLYLDFTYRLVYFVYDRAGLDLRADVAPAFAGQHRAVVGNGFPYSPTYETYRASRFDVVCVLVFRRCLYLYLASREGEEKAGEEVEGDECVCEEVYWNDSNDL